MQEQSVLVPVIVGLAFVVLFWPVIWRLAVFFVVVALLVGVVSVYGAVAHHGGGGGGERSLIVGS